MLVLSNEPKIDPESLPSTVELLRLPFVFSQAALLDEGQFRAAARQRGVSIDRKQMEVLHRRRLLVPLLREHDRAMTTPLSGLPEPHAHTKPASLRIAAEEGRLTDPADRRFRPWPSAPRRDGHLYSHFQLLSLRWLGHIMRFMKATEVIDGEVQWALDLPDSRMTDQATRYRAMAIAMEVLAPRYLPRILQSVQTGVEDDRIHAHIQDHNPRSEQNALRVSYEVLLDQAESLLTQAGFFDPLGKWTRVVRIGNTNRWKELRFDALLAHEYRVAAELLLLYLEDLADQGHCPDLPPLSTKWSQPRHDRLKVDHRERSETILDFRLLDRPAVVLAVEGETEMLIAPRVLDLFGVDEESGLVQIVNRKSIKGDIRLLARSVAIPRLDPDGYRGARLRSPATGLVLAVDPEGPSRTHAQREQQRKDMVEEVFRSLPRGAQTDEVRADLTQMIRVYAWGTETFEFAHFSDHELARAARRVGQPGAPKLADIKAAVAECRAHGSNMDNVWKRWQTKPSKPALAQELWPVLERRLLAARPSRPTPIGEVVADVLQLALNIRRVRELGPRPELSATEDAPAT